MSKWGCLNNSSRGMNKTKWPGQKEVAVDAADLAMTRAEGAALG